VTDVSVVMACRECRVSWAPDATAVPCTDPAHHHDRYELHRHRDVVVLPDGTEVVAASFDGDGDGDGAYERDAAPAFGLYLDRCWSPPWPLAHVDWPDFGVPARPSDLVTALRDLLARARRGELVEIGCRGGHGRTGTALACLAVLTGEPPESAVAWVRSQYCAHAVETDEQAAFVAALAP
jgi:hypothetical protein